MAGPAPASRTEAFECIECRRQWDVPTERWRVYITDDEPPEATVYCPDWGSGESGLIPVS